MVKELLPVPTIFTVFSNDDLPPKRRRQPTRNNDSHRREVKHAGGSIRRRKPDVQYRRIAHEVQHEEAKAFTRSARTTKPLDSRAVSFHADKGFRGKSPSGAHASQPENDMQETSPGTALIEQVDVSKLGTFFDYYVDDDIIRTPERSVAAASHTARRHRRHETPLREWRQASAQVRRSGRLYNRDPFLEDV